MKQFLTILRFELAEFFKNKVYITVTLILIAAIGIVTSVPRLTDLIKSDSSTDTPTIKDVILVTAEEDSDRIVESLSKAFPTEDIVLTDDDTNALKKAVEQGDAICAFAFKGISRYTYYVNDSDLYDSRVDTADEALENTWKQMKLEEKGVSGSEAQMILNSRISHSVETLGKNQAANFFYVYIMIMALYMITLMYGQLVATRVTAEKSSRAMELLITSAKPESLMFGKVIAACIAGIVQITLIFGSGILFYNLNKSFFGSTLNVVLKTLFDIPVDLLVYMVVFFLLGFLLYAFLFGALGSTVSRTEDLSAAISPLTMLFVIGFMVVIFSISSGNVNNTAMVVCSYIPFTSPMAMFARVAMSTVAVRNVLISISILILTTVLIGNISARIYRAGVLMYGKPPKFKDLIKALTDK